MNITVYAASSGQVPDVYLQAARDLGTCLAARGHTLVNGAGRTGLMGATIDGIQAAGGRAVGVIPQFMIDEHWEHPDMAEMIVTPDMHSRKERMAEMAEVITWKQLGLFLHPIVVLNTDGFFDPLLAQLERCAEQQFMRRIHTDIWQVASTPEEAVRLCEETPLWDANVRRFAAL